MRKFFISVLSFIFAGAFVFSASSCEFFSGFAPNSQSQQESSPNDSDDLGNSSTPNKPNDSSGNSSTPNNPNDSSGNSGTPNKPNENLPELDENASEGLKYTLSNDKSAYEVAGIGTCADTDIVISSAYKGLPVTTIRVGAFNECENVTSISIPDSVTTIYSYAFSECYGLTSMTIPDSVTTLGTYVFNNCRRLTSVKLPSGITAISGSTFRGCRSLTDVTIPESVTTIEEYAFAVCENLTTLTIPQSVTAIGNYAFANCHGFTSFVLPEGVIKLGNYVFYDCANLKNISIPNSLTTIGNWIFNKCNKLQYTVKGELNYLGNENNPYLYLDTTKTATNANIEYGCKFIGSGAFQVCTNLSSVTIPNSVIFIGEYAFSSNKQLTSLSFQGTASEWNAIVKKNNWAFMVSFRQIICSDGTVSLY